MEILNFRKASISELSAIEAIYERARSFMQRTGNPSQWKNNYPSRQLILSDLEKGELYVAIGSSIEAVFVFTDGEDPTYSYIEGDWLNNNPYCAVHRVASAGRTRGMLGAVMDFCFSRCDNIKIDTHADNVVMQHQLEKYGFKRCGTVYLEDGEARIGYQMTKR